MKKIIAILLLICCAFSVVSCKKKNTDNDVNKESAGDLEKFTAMFASSAPTKSETTITERVNSQTLTSTITLTSGVLKDGSDVAKLVSVISTLNDIENEKGSLDYISSEESQIWYHEGKGVSENKGRYWDKEGENFAPKAGDIYLDLQTKYFETVNYTEEGETQTLVLTIAADKEGKNGYAKKVLGSFIPSSMEFGYKTQITIVAAADRISRVTVEFIDEFGNTVEEALFTEFAPEELVKVPFDDPV